MLHHQGVTARHVLIRVLPGTGAPYVDEARAYIALDPAASDYLAALGYVAGVGPTSPEAPRLNYTHDPYDTDGLRAVLVLSEDPVALRDLEVLDWETPPVRSGRDAG